MADKLAIKIIRKISAVERADWDRLLGQGSPFMKWDWLDSLEQSGCVNEETGWLPHHLIVEREGKIVGGCPLYLKLHSMGEFVFDYEWAEYAHRLGIRYYPKMLVGIPFTPVTGPRFLTDPRENRRELIQLMGRALHDFAATGAPRSGGSVGNFPSRASSFAPCRGTGSRRRISAPCFSFTRTTSSGSPTVTGISRGNSLTQCPAASLPISA